MTTPRPRGPKLLNELRQALRARHYSRRTEEAYVGWVRRYVRFHGLRHPAEMGVDEIHRFLTALASRSGLSASSQTQALSALLFLYRRVLHREPGQLGELIRAKQPRRLPVVLTREEVRLLLERLEGMPRVVGILLYGSGLRLLEALELRVKDVDFAGGEIRVRRAKGAGDRVRGRPRCRRRSSGNRRERRRTGHGSTCFRRAGAICILRETTAGTTYTNR